MLTSSPPTTKGAGSVMCLVLAPAQVQCLRGDRTLGHRLGACNDAALITDVLEAEAKVSVAKLRISEMKPSSEPPAFK